MMVLPMKTYSTGKQVVNWSAIVGGDTFTINESVVEVIANNMVTKIAKASGKERKERRLTLKLQGFSDEYECGAESFKKGAFLKNLIKKSIHKLEEIIKPIIENKSCYLPVMYSYFDIWNLNLKQDTWDKIQKEEFECNTFKELKKWYRKWSNVCHPDCGGNEGVFKSLKLEYDAAVCRLEYVRQAMEEAGIDVEF